MQPFEFVSAKSPDSAVRSSAKGSASKFLAGGTTLIDLMKLNVEGPRLVVDITRLPWNQVSDLGSSIKIGALISNTEMAHHKLVTRNFPVLSQALLSGASVQLRNLATLGGNLLQRTRCSYFRDTACPCNKREPGTGCSAIKGYNRNLAILGTSEHCIATNPSDMCVALSALDTKIHIQGFANKGSGANNDATDSEAVTERVVDFNDFYKRPGTTPNIETILQPHELISAIEIPKHDWFTKSIYVKVRDRASYAFALTSAAVAFKLKNGRIEDSRIALGGVGTVPWRAKAAEDALRGKSANVENYEQAASAALVGAQGYEHNKFKIELAKQTIVRALAELGGNS